VGLPGYALTAGYDLATGLGSLDVANFLAAASSVAHTGVASTALALHGNATTISNTQTATFTATVSSSASGTPTGTVQFYANGSALGAPVTVSSGVATTAALPFPSAGTYYVTAAYSGDSNFAASTSPGFELVVTGLTSSAVVTLPSASILVGTHASFGVTVTGVVGSAVPTGTVRFVVLGNNYAANVASVLLVNGSATTPAISFPTVGNYTVTANYLGDGVYSPSSSTVSYSVNKLPSYTNISSFGQSAGIGGGASYSVVVFGGSTTGGSSAPSPTGTVQIYVDGVAQGSPAELASLAPFATFSNSGTFTITAVYSGDANWLPSTSNALSQTVLAETATFKMTSAAPSLSFAAGATTSNTDQIIGNSSLGFTGTVSLGCAVTYNGGREQPPAHRRVR
jgi:Bacterial Ig-like domain (group 3)